MSYQCDNCKDEGWVCENHPALPWGGSSNHPLACGCGAGDPCKICNDSTGRDDPPRMPPGFVETERPH